MDFFNPIFEALISIMQSKTRSILAGFGVAWGIFILIILLGTGKGFQHGIFQLFNSFAKKSIWIYGGQSSDNKLNTSTHQILFDKTDIHIIKERFNEIEFISPELFYGGNALATNHQNLAYPQIKGVLPDYFNVKIIKPDEGRLLNILDNKEYRRVALVGRHISDMLFPNENSLGKSININGTYFSIIGIIEKGSLFSQNEQNVIYVPENTFVDCFNQGREYNAFILTLTKFANASNFENEIKKFLGRRKGFDISDKKAIFIVNFDNQVQAFENLFKGINSFLWFIGLCLLLSGIVGISNIMLVIVKERTFEIGIRKAIGAKSKSIIWMIINESIAITSIAGAIGLLVGVIFINLLNWALALFFNTKDSLFTYAIIDFPTIIFSLVILIFSGVFAGYWPAIMASNITPVEAIRFESR